MEGIVFESVPNLGSLERDAVYDGLTANAMTEVNEKLSALADVAVSGLMVIERLVTVELPKAY